MTRHKLADCMKEIKEVENKFLTIRDVSLNLRNDLIKTTESFSQEVQKVLREIEATNNKNNIQNAELKTRLITVSQQLYSDYQSIG